MAKILTQRLFRRNLFGLVPLVMVSHFSSGSASAQGYDANSRCLLEIDGTTYLDGRCYFKNGAKDDFFWDQPTVRSARLTVTVLEDSDSSVCSEAQVQDISRRRFPPASIEGKGKTLGDIVSPIVDEEDWECLK